MPHPRPEPPTLRVLGVDPGLADVGYGLIDWQGTRRRGSLVAYGVIQTPPGTPLAQRLDTIYQSLAELIETHRPDAVAVEQLYFARNVKTAMVVAHGRAACILATARRRIELFEYTPLQIKQALTGHGRAGKAQVQMMVRAVLGLETIPRPDHAADALAAALCHAHSLMFRDKVDQAARRAAAAAADSSGDGQDPRKLLLARARRNGRKRR
ncbi:MAG TPA: crossover junction endodeoxyribonuclease RuvC [Candidatus Sumerlaeota bacterium]|nr:crossover junction endodeoxyribonuclease RuvC [Candidatus Sumerlaeota bacterium]HOR26460.1 crossover junction endodeoxyribonuclease RuvC [Candidatus Sumerlaeota bacterium]HPK00844.1 crossover junction endodeoxyribonuclease RuvC [Candidatus Sumerlaeota bacterium]